MHRERMEGYDPIKSDAELTAAWHQLQLHWLETIPGYREQVRERVRETLNERDAERGVGRGGRRCAGCNGELENYTADCKTCANRKAKQRHRDVDRLGREVEGCG